MMLQKLIAFKHSSILKLYLPALLGALSWAVYFSYFIDLCGADFHPLKFMPNAYGLLILAGSFPLLVFFLNKLFNHCQKTTIISVASLLLCLPGLMTIIYPKLYLVSSNLEFSVLGWLSIPVTSMLVKIPPAGYVYLVWFGFSLIGLLLISYFLFFRWTLFYQENLRQQQPRHLFWLGVLFFFTLGLWTTFIHPVTGDEPHYLMMSHSVWTDQDIDLSNQWADKIYQRFYPVENLDFHFTPSNSGKLISKHFPLLAIITAPLYGLMGRFGVVLFIMVSAALIALLLYALSKTWGFSEKEAIAVWLLSLLTVPLGIYFDLIFTELPAIALFLFGLLGYFKTGYQWKWTIVLGALLLPWFYLKYIPLAIILGCLALMKFWKTKGQLLFIGILAIGIGMLFYFYYHYFYGFGLSTNPYGEFHSLFSWKGIKNSLGLLVDRDFGLLASAPMMFLSFFGLKELKKKNSQAFWLIIIVVLVEYGMYVHFDDFTGSAAVSSRHFLPATIVLLPMVGQAFYHWYQAGGWKRTVAQALVVMTVAIFWICTACPLFKYLSPKIKLWKILGWSPSIFPSLADGMTMVEMIWAVGMIIGIVSLVFIISRKDRFSSFGEH